MQFGSPVARPGERVELTLADFAARLERRLYWADVSKHPFLDGCSYAAAPGLHDILYRPEQVELAVRAPAGATVRVALNGEEMTDEQVIATCELLAVTVPMPCRARAARGGRSGIARVEVMRQALP